ncbi:MAG: hypothetical protein ACFFD2_10535 [Promethearchaeota archaeon]
MSRNSDGKLVREKPRVNIYLSYSVMDVQNYPLKELKANLEQRDEIKEVFMVDKSKGNIDHLIKEKISQSHIILFLGTERSLKAKDCQCELQLARDEGIGIMAIKGRDLGWGDLEPLKKDLKREVRLDGDDLVEDLDFFCKKLYDFITQYKSEVLKMDIAFYILTLIPFTEKLTQIYKENIRKPLEKKGYDVKRAEDLFKPISTLKDILNFISTADIILADFTGRNPNVFYEVGRAHQQNKTVIQLVQNINDIPFDLR